jgi:hypothetical protein
MGKFDNVSHFNILPFQPVLEGVHGNFLNPSMNMLNQIESATFLNCAVLDVV